MNNFEQAEHDKALAAYKANSEERKKLQAKGWLPSWYTTQAWQMFKERYAVENEEGVKGRFQTIARVLSSYLPEKYQEEYKQKFFDLMWNQILSPASPVLANTGTDRGMNVSCSGQDVEDSVWGFYEAMQETAMLSKYGFGTSANMTNIRPRNSKISKGGTANGAKVVIDDFFTCATKISHGGMRKGSFAAYVKMCSPDYYECLNSLRSDHKGKNYGWILDDVFIERLKDGDPEAHKRWQDALHVKLLTGKGYLFFPDKANRHRPQMYKDLGLDIKATNLCTEIMLHSSPQYTYSCILSSLNLFKWDEIKNSDAVFTSMVFLDCLCSDFIAKSEGIKGLEKVREFTIKGRAVGLGTMGFATYLQSKMIPYDGLEAGYLNTEMFKHLHDEALRASQWLAKELGEPEWCKGYGVRNTHRTAQAPTKSTATLMGSMSESTSQDPGWVYTLGSAVGELERIPPMILKLMKERGVYNQDTLDRIIKHLGSVQQEDWLTDEEKLVFRNAFEVDPWAVFRMARKRQKWLCQGQSLNFFLAETEESEKEISDILSACVMDEEILSQYYLYTRSGVVINDECVACAA